jgi:hypothetical protein
LIQHPVIVSFKSDSDLFVQHNLAFSISPLSKPPLFTEQPIALC